MRILSTLIGLLLWVSVFAQTKTAADNIKSMNWLTEVSNDDYTVSRFHGELFGGMQHIVKVSFHKNDLRVKLYQPDTLRILAEQVVGLNAVAAINGSYFNMKTGVPRTYLKLNDLVLAQTEQGESFRCNAVVALNKKKCKVFELEKMDEHKVEKKFENILSAGPLLCLDGERKEYAQTRGFYTKQHPRSALALSKDSICLVVVDGRHPGNATGMSINQLSLLLSQMGFEDAINLDGGGSSTLWTKDEGVLNCPSDNKKFDHMGQRNVSNIIVLTER